MSSLGHINRDSNPHQSKTEEFPPSYWYRSERVRQRNESHGRSFLLEGVHHLRLGLHRFALLRGFLLELRSFLYRIALRCKRRYDLYGLDVGPLQQTEAGHLRWNTRTRACSEDIKSFAASRPWATMIDLEVYRDAWARGAGWAESSSCKLEKAIPS